MISDERVGNSIFNNGVLLGPATRTLVWWKAKPFVGELGEERIALPIAMKLGCKDPVTAVSQGSTIDSLATQDENAGGTRGGG